MELYKRIKKRREELGMSQEELAQKLGYKSRSSINKIEQGENDIPQSKITAFAKALKVNEAWLLGLDFPAGIESSLGMIINQLLTEKQMTLEDVANKAHVPLKWLQNIDTFIPGEMEDIIENEDIGHELDWDDVIYSRNSYRLITQVAKVLGVSGSILRVALAKQEIPLPDDLPHITAKEVFPKPDTTIDEFEKLVKPYRTLDWHGKKMVDFVLAEEHARQLAEQTGANTVRESVPEYLVLNAAHAIEGASPEDIQHDEGIMDDENF